MDENERTGGSGGGRMGVIGGRAGRGWKERVKWKRKMIMERRKWENEKGEVDEN